MLRRDLLFYGKFSDACQNHSSVHACYCTSGCGPEESQQHHWDRCYTQFQHQLKESLTSSFVVNKKALSGKFTISAVIDGLNPEFTIFSSGKSEVQSGSDHRANCMGNMEWWRPLPLKTWARLGILLLTLATIYALEFVQHI